MILRIVLGLDDNLANLLDDVRSDEDQEEIMGAFADLAESITSSRAATSAEIQGVKDDVETLKSTIDAQTESIASLRAQLESGVATQVALDAALANIADMESQSTSLKGVVDSMTSDLNAVDVVPGNSANPGATPNP